MERVKADNKLQYKAAIFDYDGTIVDSMKMWRSIGSAYARKLGAELSGDDADRVLNERLRNMSLEESADLFRTEYGAKGTDEEILADVLDMVLDNYKTNIECKEGIREVLKDFRERGIKMCIATASAKEMIETANERLGLTEYFDQVFSCVDFKTTKRSPDIYLEAARFLGEDISEILVFEDVLHAAKTASEAGFPVVGIYDEDASGDMEAIKSVCRIYLNSYADWPGGENL